MSSHSCNLSHTHIYPVFDFTYTYTYWEREREIVNDGYNNGVQCKRVHMYSVRIAGNWTVTVKELEEEADELMILWKDSMTNSEAFWADFVICYPTRWQTRSLALSAWPPPDTTRSHSQVTTLLLLSSFPLSLLSITRCKFPHIPQRSSFNWQLISQYGHSSTCRSATLSIRLPPCLTEDRRPLIVPIEMLETKSRSTMTEKVKP